MTYKNMLKDQIQLHGIIDFNKHCYLKRAHVVLTVLRCNYPRA